MIVELAADTAEGDELLTASVGFGGEVPMTLEVTIPEGPMPIDALVPVVWGLSSLFTERAEARVAAAGKTVSCQAGCGACCRQLVPITPAEARRLAAMVEAMPEPRRGAVRARFAAAVEKVARAGQLATIADSRSIRQEEAIAYQQLGIACPFLEDESCSIHPDRPSICREHIVTSPARYCAGIDGELVDKVRMEVKVTRALIELDGDGVWLPMILALRDAGPTPPATRTGPELTRELFARLKP